VVMHHVRFLSFFCVEKNFVTVICFQASWSDILQQNILLWLARI
jgi:hypothetical protein